MDGSRRVTLHNRRFVKQILPMTATTHTAAALNTTAPTNYAPVTMPQREMHITLPHEDEPIHTPGATKAVDPGHAADDLPDDAATELTGPQVTDVMDLRDAMKDEPQTEPEVPTVTLPPMTGTPISPPASHSRPRRNTKPSKKYCPEDYDLTQ